MRDDLGNRMKGYEAVARTKLEPKVPVIARIDGKAFHTLTRGMQKPWDFRLQDCMYSAAAYLCMNVQGCQLAYVQSDEISILLTDYEKETTQGWFDYKVEKMASVGASLVTSAFLVAMFDNFPERKEELMHARGLPAFDARFFSLPKDEVVNYFVWRQKDAIRNSVQMLARAHFSHKECSNKNNEQLKQMLLDEKGVAWDQEPIYCQRGLCVSREPYEAVVSYEKNGEIHTAEVVRSSWEPDMEIPLFWHDRNYIEQYL